jgi:glycosyltransferase involved in cell wall biosynthesis
VSRRILFVTTAIDRSGAGLFEAVSGLARRLAEIPNTSVTLVSAMPRRLTAEEEASWRGVTIRAEITKSRLSAALSMRQIMNGIASCDHDIVHAHGIWDGASLAGAAWARRHHKPFVLSPHGMLEPWAMRDRRAKKLLPWLAWEKATVRSAAVVETKSRMEAANVRRLGFRNPLAVIPIAMDDGARATIPVRRNGVRTCLFLSRIHPKKGIALLLEAWRAVRPEGWQLLIAGPDGGAYQRTLERLADSSASCDVRWIGPAYGKEKWRLFQSADLFCLPSLSENFGVVVIEALSQGVPVITTTATPWDELSNRNCGWQVPPTRSGIQAALAEAAALPADELREMGEHGRHYVDEHFRWDVIVQDTLDLYGWVCDRGPPPRCVVCDFDSIDIPR